MVSANEWSRAFALAREHPECKRDVYLPYAHRMASESKFVEAQKGTLADLAVESVKIPQTFHIVNA